MINMTGQDCATMCNFIYIYIYIDTQTTHSTIVGRINASGIERLGRMTGPD